jgi:gas vesicle protein
MDEEGFLLKIDGMDSNNEEEYVMTNDRGGSLGAVGLAFVSGGLLGAAMALLMAPRSGRQTREQLRGYARGVEENLSELNDTVTESVDQVIDKGHEWIHDTQAALTEAVEAGRVSMHRERERPSSKEKG